jgi:hypothetical protein
MLSSEEQGAFRPARSSYRAHASPVACDLLGSLRASCPIRQNVDILSAEVGCEDWGDFEYDVTLLYVY